MNELPILPAFSENNVAITLQSSDFFAPYTSVIIQSILAHVTDCNCYDLIITSKDMTEENAVVLCTMADPYPNVSIRVVNVKEIYDRLIHVEDKRFGGETVTRIFLMELLPDYDKVLNLDSDMIVCADVAELYATDVTDYYMGAVQDFPSYYSYRSKSSKAYFGPKTIHNVLKIDRIESYFNGGLFLLNLKKIRNDFKASEIADAIMKNQLRFLEQDAFSSLFFGAIKGLEWEWNWQFDPGDHYQKLISKIYDKSGYCRRHRAAKKNPKIIHYLSETKPWDYERTEYADIWWDYAAKSPYYQEIVGRRLKKAEYAKPAQRILIVCETPYHLFTAIQIKHQLYKDVPADIVFTSSADFSRYISNLNELNLFDNIYESQYTVVRDVKELRRTAPNKSIIKHPEKCKYAISLKNEYSDYFMPVFSSPFQKILYFTLIKKGKLPRVHIFEDGAITYIEEIQSAMEKDTFDHRILPSARQFLNNVCEIMVRNPSLFIADSLQIPVTKLPQFDSSDCEILKIMTSVFGKQELPKEKYIFFNEAFTTENKVSNDEVILQKVADYVGKDNIVVKLHPRAAVERGRYTSLGFKIYENDSPWETAIMHPEIENKVLLSLSSNSLVTPWSVGEKMPCVVYLWKVMKLSKRHHVVETKFPEFISLVGEKMNRLRKTMFCPNTMSELIEIIKYIEGETK